MSLAERYQKALALASSPNAHEAAHARDHASRLAEHHDLCADVVVVRRDPGGKVLGARLLMEIVHYVSLTGGELFASWHGTEDDLELGLWGTRRAVARVRVLYAGARAGLALAAVGARLGAVEELLAFNVAGAAAFGRNLLELARWSREDRRAMVVWRAPLEEPDLAEAEDIETPQARARLALLAELRRVLVRCARARELGVRAGQLLGSRLELSAPLRP